jgi:hypothetical protein
MISREITLHDSTVILVNLEMHERSLMRNYYHAVVGGPSYWDGVLLVRREVLSEAISLGDELSVSKQGRIVDLALELRRKSLLSSYNIVDTDEFNEYLSLTSVGN